MSDRVCANITIGGTVSPKLFAELTGIIASYDLRTEWDGPPFDPSDLPDNDALRLFAEEVPWGIFEDLEQFCCDEGLTYQRWSGCYPGSFGAERIVYDGKNGPLNYSVDDSDNVMLHAQTIDHLGSMRAIRHYLAQAEIVIPPFSVADTK
jgi:hypothetical protein